jgi:RNA polymerase sigma-B factor
MSPFPDPVGTSIGNGRPLSLPGRDREDMIMRHMPLARSLARRYARTGEPLEDIIQVATIGLINAVDRYDGERGSAFVSFAVPTILGEIRRHFRDRASAVHVPRAVSDARPAVTAATDALHAERGRVPSPGDIAEETGIAESLVREALEVPAARRPLSLSDEPDDEGPSLSQRLGAEEPGYAAAEARADLADGLATLSPRERVILHLRFQRDMTQSEIAKVVGLSQMHVSRLIRAALNTLQREALAA